jgi:Leucine-rich repeat (LRR) protein
MKKQLLTLLLCLPLLGMAQTTYVPDDDFEDYLENHNQYGSSATYPNSMGDGIANNNYVTTANISSVLILDVGSQDIYNLTGIEDFTALEALYCNSNAISNLDLSNNLNLYHVNCRDNMLNTLVLNPNNIIEALYCSGNNLTTLDLSNNNVMSDLRCEDNNLTTLELGLSPNLSKVYCSFNNLTTLDLSDNSIRTLDCSHNTDLTTLNVSNCSQLVILNVERNNLTSLDLSTNLILEYLFCDFNFNLSSLDLSNNSYLKVLHCNNNNITSLNLSNCTGLLELFCHSNNLTSLDIKNGNNSNINFFSSHSNPNLSCINVDDVAYSTANWIQIDSSSSFDTNCPVVGVEEINTTNKTLFKITDVLGRNAKGTKNIPLFYIYDDGTVEKRIIIE